MVRNKEINPVLICVYHPRVGAFEDSSTRSRFSDWKDSFFVDSIDKATEETAPGLSVPAVFTRG